MNITRKILCHWLRATAAQRADGAAWYREAGRLVSDIARKHGHSRATVAGVIAAVSPRVTWGRNLAVAREFLAGGAPGGVFRANAAKARAIVAGAKPLAVLGGDKVRAFYRALMGDRGACVIDVWMLRACGLSPVARLERNGLYATVARAVGVVARQLCIAVADLQATIWIVVRGSAA